MVERIVVGGVRRPSERREGGYRQPICTRVDCEKIDENVGLPFGATKCSDAHTFFADPLHYY